MRRSRRFIERRFDLQRLTSDPVPEGLTFEQFHRDERPILNLIDFVDRADIRMVQRGRGTCLAAESLQCLRVFGEFLGKNFSATWRPSLRSSAS